MDDFAAFLRDCTRADLASMPLKCMSAEEISRRNEEDLKYTKKQIKENR